MTPSTPRRSIPGSRAPARGRPPAGVAPLCAAAVFALAAASPCQDAPQPAPAGESRLATPGAPVVEVLHDALRTVAAGRSLAAGFAVGLGHRNLHRSAVGGLGADQQLPLDAAGTWLAVATILALRDDGTLDLDLPAARYLAEFDRPDKRQVTLRQCLSCTGGFHDEVPAAERAHTWDEALAVLADHPLRNGPGVEFVPGGVGLQVAAAAAVRATGTDWQELFARRIAAPLGLRATQFRAKAPGGIPWVAGGAWSTLADFERFVCMLALGGEFDGARVLQQDSVDLMFRDHTRDLTVRDPGFRGDEVTGYGLGTWLQRCEGGGVRGSAPGASGFVPWIDRDLGLYGVLAVQDRLPRILPRARGLQAAAREHAASPAVAGRDLEVRLPHGGRERRYLLHLPPGAERARMLPLLVVLHDAGGSGERIARTTGFSRLADRHGFVAVYPDGTGPVRGRNLTWNSGGIPLYASAEDVDDTAFLLAMVADVQTRVAIDPVRVSATGLGNGAMMCHRLAREAASVFAAIAPVAGAMNFTAAHDETPMAVMVVHGTGDEHVPYAGGRPARGPGGNRTDASVADAVGYYRARNGLGGASRVEEREGVRVETWGGAPPAGAAPPAPPAPAPGAGAEAEEEEDAAVGDEVGRQVGKEVGPAPPAQVTLPVVLVTLQGGGHAWPGGEAGQRPGAGPPFPWPASERIWSFLAAARRAAR